jgi:putative peptide zinc metalloprotease protein
MSDPARRKRPFETATHSPVQLRDGVARMRRARGHTVLVSPDGSSATRIGEVGEELLPLLMRGADIDRLAAFLQQQHPLARDVSVKLDRFLAELDAGDLLATGYRPAKRPRPGVKRFALVNPDRVAKELAQCWARIPPAPSRWLLAVLMLAAAIGLVAAWMANSQWLNPVGLVRRFDFLGLAVFILAIVPLHELGHAVACRAAGMPVTGAGIILHNFVIPGPYVDTTQAYRVANRSGRFWIPATGPLVNFLAAGTAAWIVVLTHGDGVAGRAALYVLLLSCLFVYLDTNPLTPSDGSHMLEALLDDELARRTALSRRRTRLSMRPVVNTYRLACLMHLVLAALIVVWLSGLLR